MGQLDEAGFFATFGGGECVITDPDGNQIGSIPKTSKCLYKVVHEGEVIAVAEEILTPEQFHRRMGHVSIKTTCKLVNGKRVQGVRLDGTPDPDKFFCESCVYAKATRKPVPKKRQGDRAKDFADEIHSDLWGKSPIESKGGKRYWITFTDDKTDLHGSISSARRRKPSWLTKSSRPGWKLNLDGVSRPSILTEVANT